MTRQQMLLTQLMEECNEVAQRCSKAIRFGFNDKQSDEYDTNLDRIMYELQDLAAVANMIHTGEGNETLYTSLDEDMFHLKEAKVEKYLEYSKSLGILEPDENGVVNHLKD